MSWKTCTLDECISLRSGSTPSKQNPSFWNGTIPWASSKELKQLRLYNTESRVTQEAIKSASSVIDKGTVLIVVRGMVLAKEFPVSIAQVTMTFNQDLKAVDPKGTAIDRSFLPYLLLGHREGLRSLADEAAHGTKRIQTDRLLAYKVELPSPEVQKRIASILSAYDDLIENNTRRIEVLEEMARRLYEEWFVQFRFPGHEDAVFEKMTINNVADVVRGRSYRSAELVEEGRPFVNLKCVNRDGGYRRDGLKYYSGKYKPEQLVTSGDIIMAVTDMTQERRIVARVALVPDLGEQEGVISMDLVRIVPKSGVPPLYLYAFFRWSDFADNVKNHATGANVLHLHPDLIVNYDINLPPQEVCKLFAEKVRPAIELVDVLEKKNANLRAQRDLLLPKLISGEIDVSDIPMPT